MTATTAATASHTVRVPRDPGLLRLPVSTFLFLSFVALVSGERHISLSAVHSCIVASDQRIGCSGDNSFNQSNVQTGPFCGVSVGDTFTCGLLMNESAACWGALTGICSSGGPPTLLKSPTSGVPATFLDIAAGVAHVCGLQRNGTVLCYGDARVPSPTGLLFQAISSGANFSCGVLRSGALQCWGDVSNAAVSETPPNGTDFVEVAAGAAHACALFWNGSVACWGDNSCGAVSPVAAGSYIWLSSGIGFTCGILDGGGASNVLSCWGAILAPGTRGYSAAEISCWTGECIFVNVAGIVTKQVASQTFGPVANKSSIGLGGLIGGLAMSANSSHLVAVVHNGFIYTSADFGATWTQRGTSQNWLSVASSADFGATWAQQGSSGSWASVASSSDGTFVVAGDSSGAVYFPCASYSTSASCPFLSFIGPSLVGFQPKTDAFAVWRMLAIGPVAMYGGIDLMSVPAKASSLTATSLLGWNTAVFPLNFSAFTSLSSVAPFSFSAPAFGRYSQLTLPTGNVQPLELFPGTFAGFASLRSINSAIPGTLNFTGTKVFASGYEPGTFSWSLLLGITFPTMQNPLILDSCLIKKIMPSPPTQFPPFLSSQVTSLSMQSNELASLDATYFAGFTALQTLKLDFKNISFAAFDTISAFQQPNLVMVTFANNPLPSVSCPPSYYNSIDSVPAGGLLPACFTCLSGSYCSGDGVARTCLTGSYNSEAGQSNASACRSCPIGTYNSLPGQTILGCVSCAAGTASSTPFATSDSDCLQCSPGSFAPLAGSSVCSLCERGSYASDPRAAGCTLCDFGSYAPTKGSTRCLPCANGTTTSSTGATSVNLCKRIFPGCPTGFQPAGTAVPQQLSDCVPLLCLPPLSLSVDGASCIDACGVGSIYNVSGSTCAICGPNRICPGFSISFPAVNSSSGSSASFSMTGNSGLPASQISSQRIDDLCASQQLLVLSSSNAALSTKLSTPIIVVIAVGSSVVVFLAIAAAVAWSCISNTSTGLSESAADTATAKATNVPSKHHSRCYCFSAFLPSQTPCTMKLLEAIDLFSVRIPKKKGEATISFPTALGGLCTIAGIVTICCLALVSIIRRNQDNVASISTLAVLDPTTLQSDLLTPPSFAMSGRAWTGMRIRIFSTLASPLSSLSPQFAENGSNVPCAALAPIPGAFAYGGLASGTWQLSSVANCGDDSTSALILTCPDCVFSSASFLTVALPWQCQTLSIDAAAVSATGTLSTASMPVSITSATRTALLRNISWAIAPVLDMLDDQISATRKRGLRLISLSQTSMPAPDSLPGVVNLTLLPAAASVTLSFALPLQGYYSSTVATEKVSTLQLLASVVGLAGLLGAFRLLHSIFSNVKSAPAVVAAAVRRLSLLRSAAGRAAPKNSTSRRALTNNSPSPQHAPGPEAVGTMTAVVSSLNPINTTNASLVASRTSIAPLPIAQTGIQLVSIQSPPTSSPPDRLHQSRLEQQERQIQQQEQRMQELERQQNKQTQQVLRVQELELLVRQLLSTQPRAPSISTPALSPSVATAAALDARGLRAQSIAFVSSPPPSFSATILPPASAPEGPLLDPSSDAQN